MERTTLRRVTVRDEGRTFFVEFDAHGWKRLLERCAGKGGVGHTYVYNQCRLHRDHHAEPQAQWSLYRRVLDAARTKLGS